MVGTQLVLCCGDEMFLSWLLGSAQLAISLTHTHK